MSQFKVVCLEDKSFYREKEGKKSKQCWGYVLVNLSLHVSLLMALGSWILASDVVIQ